MYLEKCGKKYNPFAHFENITSAICTFGGDGVEADQEKSKTD